MTFLVMLAVRLRVVDVIDGVYAGRAEAEGEEGDDSCPDGSRITQCMSREQGNKHQQVLDPLMHAHQTQEGSGQPMLSLFDVDGAWRFVAGHQNVNVGSGFFAFASRISSCPRPGRPGPLP